MPNDTETCDTTANTANLLDGEDPAITAGTGAPNPPPNKKDKNILSQKLLACHTRMQKGRGSIVHIGNKHKNIVKEVSLEVITSQKKCIQDDILNFGSQLLALGNQIEKFKTRVYP